MYFWIINVRRRPQSVHVYPHSKNQKLILLLIDGINQNPGSDSVLKFPCGVCDIEVEHFCARDLCCNSCDKWIQKSCVGMLTVDYEEHEANRSAPWLCPDYGLPQHSDILYDATDSVGSVYSDVSENEPSTLELSITTSTSLSFSSPGKAHLEIQTRDCHLR